MQTRHTLQIALVWRDRLLESRVFGIFDTDNITIGEPLTSDFVIPMGEASPQHTLFRRDGGRYTFHRQDGSDPVPLGLGDSGFVAFGEIMLGYRVEPEEALPIPRRSLRKTKGALWAVLGLVAFVHLSVLLIESTSPPDNTLAPMASGSFRSDKVFMPMYASAEPDLFEPAPNEEVEALGLPEALPQLREMSDGFERDERFQVNSRGIRHESRNNILGEGPLQDLFGDTDGFDIKMNMAMSGSGNLITPDGVEKMGLHSTGTGGGGEGFGRIHGMGHIERDGCCGDGRLRLRRSRPQRRITVEMLSHRMLGSCQSNDIRREIGRKMGAFRYCYERNLQNKAPSGQVSMHFLIDSKTSKTNATINRTTLGSPAIERCLLRAARRLRFDPPDAGICVVEVPIAFVGSD